MKNRYFILLLGLFLYNTLLAVVNTGPDEKYILVISSYSERVEWAKNIGDGIVLELKTRNPDARVYVDYLGADNTFTLNGLLGKVRAIFQSGDNNKAEASKALTDLSLRSVFYTNRSNKPSALVFIGDEMWIVYRQLMGVLETWNEVPVLLCGVRDSISAVTYYPQLGANLNSMIAIEDSPFMSFTGDSTLYHLAAAGIIHTLPLWENLELIKTLVPDLKELVFVDERYYATEYVVKELKKEITRFDPNLRFSVHYTNWINTDSILAAMLQPGKGVVFLTYSWNLENTYSRYTDGQIDSLFEKSRTPVFSLMPQGLNNNRILGGYYSPVSEYVDPAVEVLSQILSGSNADSLPFQHMGNPKFFLNQKVLEKCGLNKQSRKLKGEIRENIPPTFYQANEINIILTIICLVVAVGTVFLWLRRRIHMKRLRLSYLEYKQLFDELQLIYAHLPIDFALYTKNGRQIERIIGGNDAEGKNVRQKLLSENLFENSYLNRTVINQILNGETANCELSVDASGQLSPYNFSGNNIFQFVVKPLKGIDGRSFRYIAIIIDKTLESRERAERERFESLFHFASDCSKIGVAYSDALNKTGFASRSWYSNLNEVVREQLEPEYGNVFPEDRDLLKCYREQMKNGISPVCSADIRVLSEDGKIHWIRQFFFQYDYKPEEGRVVLVELNFNIDEQKQKESELRKAKEQAEEDNREKGKFLENISHEIRTPLNAIVGFTSILASGDDYGDLKESGEIIRRNSESLMQLIGNILDLSKIDAGRAEFTPSVFDLNEVYEQIIAYAQEKISNAQIKIYQKEKEEAAVIETDRTRFCQVLTHLVRNALKFTNQGEIALGYGRVATGYYFYVTDTGCGIEGKNIKNIFRRFVKIDTFTQGSGLGLPLCQSIIQKLGGKIGVDSVVGKGSTFWFTLPLKATFKTEKND